MSDTPIVLCVGGHDPTGGAGIQADIETVRALGGRAITIVTALTVQDTRNVSAIDPVSTPTFRATLATLLADIRPDAVKIGLLAGCDQVDLLAASLAGLDVPVVLDPVLAAGGGFGFGNADIIRCIRDRLLPRTTLATPNREEARRLTGEHEPARAATALLDLGAGAVLLTGADEAGGDEVENQLWLPGPTSSQFRWPLLPGVYHGSGCTLASACAVSLGRGMAPEVAVTEAQTFTHQALTRATAPGHGQFLPTR
ncbi:MAG: hydroxymethylpyrimidine/phosphomethylpyrimidine kinase [Gammaproteobacteria bacterium]|nr:hydroxymethylpyrimidine/phosphomethylpyrimidine kinase [Gammaproteobacteria bacterium]